MDIVFLKIHLVAEKLDMFNFHPIFSYCYQVRDLNTLFLKKNQQKRKYHKEEKQDFERFLILLNIKMPAKSKKNKLNEEFIAICREEQSLIPELQNRVTPYDVQTELLTLKCYFFNFSS